MTALSCNLNVDTSCTGAWDHMVKIRITDRGITVNNITYDSLEKASAAGVVFIRRDKQSTNILITGSIGSENSREQKSITKKSKVNPYLNNQRPSGKNRYGSIYFLAKKSR